MIVPKKGVKRSVRVKTREKGRPRVSDWLKNEVREYKKKHPQASIRQMAKEFPIHYNTIWKILNERTEESDKK